jgi:hypothetical protein
MFIIIDCYQLLINEQIDIITIITAKTPQITVVIKGGLDKTTAKSKQVTMGYK